MEASTAAKGTRSTVGPVAQGEEFPSARSIEPGEENAVDRVKRMKDSASEDDKADATAWFLSEADANVLSAKTFGLNVSADPDNERIVEWTVQAISRHRIRQIRKASREGSRRGMAETIDETKVNLKIAAEGTVVPNLREIAAGIGSTNPETVLERRMAHKPGLIDLIAGEVLSVSGYDDDDVRDVEAGKP